MDTTAGHQSTGARHTKALDDPSTLAARYRLG